MRVKRVEFTICCVVPENNHYHLSPTSFISLNMLALETPSPPPLREYPIPSLVGVCARGEGDMGIYFMGECHICTRIFLNHCTSLDIIIHHSTSLDTNRHHDTSLDINRHHYTSLDITRHHYPSPDITLHH